MAIPELYLPQWGQQAGQNLLAGQMRRREQEQRNALSQALPGALGGDQAAMNRLLQVSPELGVQVYGQQQTRQQALGKEKETAFQGALTNVAKGILSLPPERRPEAWTASATRLAQLYPEQVAAQQITPEWDETVEPELYGLAGAKAYESPEAKLTELQRNLADPNTRAYLEAEAARKGAAGGSSAPPYFTPILSSTGVYSFDNRTGRTQPAVLDGKPILPIAADPVVRSAVTAAEQTAKADVERDTALRDRTRQADRTLSLLDQAESILTGKETGAKPTGSLGGKVFDTVVGAAGVSTKGAQATNRLNIIAGELIGSVPRFEGPQSNFDVQIYMQMAGQLNDATLPVETRLAAAQQMRILQQKYATGAPQSAAPEQAPASAPARRLKYNPATGAFE